MQRMPERTQTENVMTQGQEAPVQNGIPARRMQVLLITHEAECLRQADWLAAGGYEAVVAREMDEVLELLMSIEPDVIVLDLNFSPSGLDVLPIARMAHPRTPVITMADLKLHDVAIRSVKAGASAYILKPLDRDRLSGLVQTLSRTASDHRPSHVLERMTGSLG